MWGAKGFVVRNACGEWLDPLPHVYQWSEIALGTAYVTTAIAIYAVWKTSRKHNLLDIKNYKTTRLFPCLFILTFLFCGVSHYLDALAFVWPAYNSFALFKAVTAIISFPAPIVFWMFHIQVITRLSEKSHENQARAEAAESRAATLETIHNHHHDDEGIVTNGGEGSGA